ncbi:TPA: hypothetical protein DDZ86_04580 [Candidatus Dependentiae bacterium]|nr:MAG: hypothetical protein UW09_C0002G0147 [candidate division TM6 bacterium GW2011_GWF2_43_87]HBL98889.1 hypothetical protein [Candidatus Dependentiae bacterium]
MTLRQILAGFVLAFGVHGIGAMNEQVPNQPSLNQQYMDLQNGLRISSNATEKEFVEGSNVLITNIKKVDDFLKSIETSEQNVKNQWGQSINKLLQKSFKDLLGWLLVQNGRENRNALMVSKIKDMFTGMDKLKSLTVIKDTIPPLKFVKAQGISGKPLPDSGEDLEGILQAIFHLYNDDAVGAQELQEGMDFLFGEVQKFNVSLDDDKELIERFYWAFLVKAVKKLTKEASTQVIKVFEALGGMSISSYENATSLSEALDLYFLCDALGTKSLGGDEEEDEEENKEEDYNWDEFVADLNKKENEAQSNIKNLVPQPQNAHEEDNFGEINLNEPIVINPPVVPQGGAGVGANADGENPNYDVISEQGLPQPQGNLMNQDAAPGADAGEEADEEEDAGVRRSEGFFVPTPFTEFLTRNWQWLVPVGVIGTCAVALSARYLFKRMGWRFTFLPSWRPFFRGSTHVSPQVMTTRYVTV